MSEFISKPNSVILSGQKLSAAQSNLLSIIFTKFNKDSFVFSEQELINKTYTIKFSEFIPNFKANKGKTNYSFARKHARSIIQQHLQTKSENNTLIQNIISEIDVDKSKAKVSVKLSVNIISTLLDMTKTGYTKILFEDYIALKNQYSKRLYEIIDKHRGEWGVKTKKVYEIEIQELRFLLGIESSKYKRFNNLRERVIAPSVQEINKKTNLSLSFDTKRTGKNVSAIIFRNIIMKKGSAKKNAAAADKKTNPLLKALHENSRDYFQRNHTPEYIKYYHEKAKEYEFRGLITSTFANCFYSFLKNDADEFYKNIEPVIKGAIVREDPIEEEPGAVGLIDEFNDLPEVTKKIVRAKLAEEKKKESISVFCPDWLYFSNLVEDGKLKLVEGIIQGSFMEEKK